MQPSLYSETFSPQHALEQLLAAVRASDEVLIPPLSRVSRDLLALSDADLSDLRLLTLIARSDPLFSVRLLAHANGKLFSGQPPVTPIDEAVRRVGPRHTHALLLACATAQPFLLRPQVAPLGDALFQHALASAITARNLANWASLPESVAAQLYLGSLMYPLALYLGLVQKSPVSDPLLRCMREVVASGSIAWTSSVGLTGFERVSAAIVKKWGLEGAIPDALNDAASRAPGSHAGQLLLAVQRLLEQKHSKLDEALVLGGLGDALGPLAPSIEPQRLRLAVVP